MSTAYAALTRRFERLHHLGHLQSLASWDRAAMMPAKGNEARAAALSEMASLMHGMLTDPALSVELGLAQAEDLDDEQGANLREMRRAWRAANALPPALVERRTAAAARCEHAWRRLRPANDWAGFQPGLQEVLDIEREVARRLADDSGLTPYEALMDQYEPGLRLSSLETWFGDLRRWLPGLIDRAVLRQAHEPILEPKGPFPVAAQRLLCRHVVQWLGFDFGGGRLDESAHPFCGGVPEDVRMTTRFREDDFVCALMGTVHETGHARYEQNLPRRWLGQPLALARSAALHESQSLAFEMQLGGHPGFVGRLAPLLADAFGMQAAFEPGNLARWLGRVRRGLIRVDADEVTYPAHILLRTAIEQDLIEGRIEAADIPARWDQGMMDLLGLDTRGNHSDGAMQDVHWAEGLFGYFPCYTLGAMYAAQWFAAMRRQLPGLDAQLDAGEFGAAFDWLASRIWHQGSRWTTEALCQRASGEPLNPAHLRAHLESRYG